jgi:hypothetical protein
MDLSAVNPPGKHELVKATGMALSALHATAKNLRNEKTPPFRGKRGIMVAVQGLEPRTTRI